METHPTQGRSSYRDQSVTEGVEDRGDGREDGTDDVGPGPETSR